MKYIVMDWKGNDLFTKEFDNKEDAIAEAKRQWNNLTYIEKGKRDFYVLESINPDEDAEDHFDGNEVWRPTKYTVLYTDENGATSEIDNFEKDMFYTAEDYISDCEKNADEEWVDMLHAGTVELIKH